MSLASVQREDAKAQSALDLKKQNLKDETKKRKELVKSMEEVIDSFVTASFFFSKPLSLYLFLFLGQESACGEGKRSGQVVRAASGPSGGRTKKQHWTRGS